MQIDGAREFRRGLRAAGDDLSDLRTVHKAVAAIAAAATARLVPVRSGRLLSTIRSSGTKTAAIVRAGNNTRVPYANPIHWGWFRRGIRAQPFASHGAQQSEPRWLPIYENYTDTALEKIKGI